MSRSDTQPMEAEIPDDRPLAVRRKRRLTSSLANGEDASDPQPRSMPAGAASASTKTPTKAKKKVRFSDPGSELSAAASSSTGLTPALKRTAVQDSRMLPPKTPRLLSQDPHRRRSLPLNLSNPLPSPSLTPPATPMSGEVQFAPFRQVLDERSKRRLRRNNMSKEQHDIETENNKSKAVLRKEMQDLKDELAAARRLQQEINDTVKGEEGSHEKIHELEHELELLKREMRDRSLTAEPITNPDEVSTPQSPIPSIYNDDHNDDFIMVDADAGEISDNPTVPSPEKRFLQDTTHLHVAASSTDAASQTSATSSNAENDAFREARLELERLFPGEIALGLKTKDPQPLLKTMIERLQTMKAYVLVSNDSLTTSRTSENNIRSQFNAMLEQLNRARTHGDEIAEQRDREKDRADVAQNEVQSVRHGLKKATGEIKALETELGDSEQSIQKLQDALETYRTDVTRLEMLITNMESEHKAVLSKLQNDMDEAVADLDCQVAAESVGRKAAEGESVERGERIKQLKRFELELRDAMNEKQEVIRGLEKELATVREEKEKDVGTLNVEIGKLASNLVDATSEINKLKADSKTLLFRIEEEKAAGMKAVEDVQAEMARCVEKSEDVKSHHIKDMQSRGTGVNEHKGLLTPVTGGRYRDVEGYVEVQRGKGKRSRPDSGIHVVEEVEEGEDEFMLNSDM